MEGSTELITWHDKLNTLGRTSQKGNCKLLVAKLNLLWSRHLTLMQLVTVVSIGKTLLYFTMMLNTLLWKSINMQYEWCGECIKYSVCIRYCSSFYSKYHLVYFMVILSIKHSLISIKVSKLIKEWINILSFNKYLSRPLT